MKYKISIIIPIHNIEKYLTHTLDSLLKQTIGSENLEVIMVNDCSTDDSGDIINKYENKYENFKAIHLQKNCGLPGEPRNIGLEQASGEYIMFMDHDDFYSDDSCKVLYEKIYGARADLLFSRYINVFDDGKTKKSPSLFKHDEEIKVDNISEEIRLLAIEPSIWTKIFKRSFLIENNIRFPKGMLAEDLSFIVKSLLKAKGVVYLNNFFSYNYRIRNSDYDKSTIHIRNKKYLMAMINGYHDTYSILKSYGSEKYFPIIFQSHLNYWTESLILSNTNSTEKIELIKEINFFYNKFEKHENKLKLRDKYYPLINLILKKEFNEAAALIEVMSNYEKKEIKLKNNLNASKKQVATLQSTNGWLKYKIKNLNQRAKKKF